MNGRSPSVYDVAEAAGVSTASVSRYFRSPEKLSAATAQRVERAVESLGYLPSGLARGLAERRSGMIGLYSFSGHEPDELVRDVRGVVGRVARAPERGRAPRLFPLFADEVLRGVELECTLRRLPLAIGWQDVGEGGVGLDDIAQRSDGVILLPSTIPDAHLRRLARRMPVVLIAQPVPEGVNAVSVTVDNEVGMRALTEHLVEEHGAETFWYCGHIDGAEHSARFEGFAAALRARDIPVPESPILATGSRAGTSQALHALLEERPGFFDELPDAIVCSSDQTALGLLEVLSERGVAVPDDVAVVGFDGIDAGRFSRPSLTTIRQPMDDLGREAVALLQRMIEGGDRAESVVLPVTLVVRDSCGCG